MLEQVIYNLLNNAAIHTASHCQISIAASCHADLLQLIIEDNGEGFTAIAMKDAFDKLSRYKNPKTSGSGLGLSIVKGFTEALEGTVDLEKPAGGGARFILCFPVKTNYFNVPANE
jgi:two-component system sensor histidine kinase KdpD